MFECHSCSIFPLKTNNINVIKIIDGIKKFSRPNIIKHNILIKNPVNAEI